MRQSTNFQVYNASAGSGKTFTLVKEYLKVLLYSEDIFHFQNMLAITFTNKAAAEMKERVLHNLQAFSEGKENDLFQIILNEISVDKPTIQERSKKILDAILQNYSAFSIITIDSFTYKIIKNFAFDLGLSINFEVEMDAVSLLNEAVDVLISKIGTDKEITKLLIDFSLDKIDDDRSWDISRELNEFSRILLNEDDTKHFRKLADKSIEDFLRLKKKLQIKNRNIEKEFQTIGESALTLIEEKGIHHSEFAYSGEFPKHFIKLTQYSSLKIDAIKFDGRLNKTIEEGKNFFAAKASENSKSAIHSIEDQLVDFYKQSKELYDKHNAAYILNKLILKSVVPLAVLHHINSELSYIKEINNIRLNAEFNQLISDQIKDQPAPFIYERIGQKYMHYFIDEMQDTSVLQWQNLIPLVENALAQEHSNLLLVGDGKQAIYRWRGGKAAQFIELGSKTENAANPFHISKDIKKLEVNFRSFSEVIGFNNQFFKHASKFLKNDAYKKLFLDGTYQLENTKKGGFVSLSFLEKLVEKEDELIKYPKKVLEIIQHLDPRFSLSDVCVLVRKKKDGIAVANYLSENGIDIISSETLLLQNSSKVNFIVNLLQIIQHPNDKEIWMEILHFLHKHLQLKIDEHSFLSEIIHQRNEQIFKKLGNYGILFHVDLFYQLPFYEKVEEIIRSFRLINSSDAYVQFFLDIVLEQQRKGTSIQEFLDFWDTKKETLSIITPETSNAVQVMTIHKSKGLEFPIVIFPYDLDIYRQVNPKVWLHDLPKETFEGFEEFLISFNKDLKSISNKGSEIYQQEREELELDNFNLLYVALTRAIEQLYIVTEKKISRKGDENINFYSGIFINYLKESHLWDDEKLEYFFGNPKRLSDEEKEILSTKIQEKFISTPWREHDIHMLANSSKLWDTTQGKAIEFGDLIHEMMSKIVLKNDAKEVVFRYVQQGIIDDKKGIEIEKIIHEIVNHQQLVTYFSEEVTVFNEREIVTIDHQIIIPDRLVFNPKNELIIIDYKTGKPSKSHHQQVLKYEQALKSMNFNITKKLLVYIDNTISVEEI